jgi:hypothetical protein
MKFTKNGSEEVIELSQNVITHNHLEDERVGFIKAEVTSVLTDTSEIVNTIMQQDSNDLPDIVRNMSWHDPFYESSNNGNDIIMAFDIDRTKYDRFALPRILGIGIMILIISFLLEGLEVWYLHLLLSGNIHVSCLLR